MASFLETDVILSFPALKYLRCTHQCINCCVLYAQKKNSPALIGHFFSEAVITWFKSFT